MESRPRTLNLNNYERCDLRQDDGSFHSLSKFLMKTIKNEIKTSTTSSFISNDTPIISNNDLSNSNISFQPNSLSAVERALSYFSTSLKLKFMDAINYRISLLPTFPDTNEDGVMKLTREIYKLLNDLNIDMRPCNSSRLSSSTLPSPNNLYSGGLHVNTQDVNMEQYNGYHQGYKAPPSSPPYIVEDFHSSPRSTLSQSDPRSNVSPTKRSSRQPKEVEVLSTDDEVEFVEESYNKRSSEKKPRRTITPERKRSPEKKPRRKKNEIIGTAVFVAEEEPKKKKYSPKKRYHRSKSPFRESNDESSDSSSSSHYNQIKKSLKSTCSSHDAKKLYKSIYKIRSKYDKVTQNLNSIEHKSKIRQQLLEEMKVVMNILNNSNDYDVRVVCQRHLNELQNSLKKYSYGDDDMEDRATPINVVNVPYRNIKRNNTFNTSLSSHPHVPLTHDYLEETQFNKALNNTNNFKRNATAATQTIANAMTRKTVEPTIATATNNSSFRRSKDNKVVIQVGSNIISVRSTDNQDSSSDSSHSEEERSKIQKKKMKNKKKSIVEDEDSSDSSSEEERPKIKKKKKSKKKSSLCSNSTTTSAISLNETINAEITRNKHYHTKKTKKTRESKRELHKFTSDDSCCISEISNDKDSVFSNGRSSVLSNSSSKRIIKNIQVVEMTSVTSEKKKQDNRFSEKLDTLIEKIDQLQTVNAHPVAAGSVYSASSKVSRSSKISSVSRKSKLRDVEEKKPKSKQDVVVEDGSSTSSTKSQKEMKVETSSSSDENPQERAPVSNTKSGISSVTNLHSNIKTNKRLIMEDDNATISTDKIDRYNSYDTPVRTPGSTRVNTISSLTITPPITNESSHNRRGYHSTSSIHREKLRNKKFPPPPPPTPPYSNNDIENNSYYHLPSYATKSKQYSHVKRHDDVESTRSLQTSEQPQDSDYFLFEEENEGSVQSQLQSKEESPIQQPPPPKMVKVEAPETLPEFFSFEAKLGNNTFWVTVPAGGVKKGQIFTSPVHYTTLPGSSPSPSNNNLSVLNTSSSSTPVSNNTAPPINKKEIMDQKELITEALTKPNTTLAQNKEPLLPLMTETVDNKEMSNENKIKDNAIVMNIPTGKWRNGLCDCLLDGVDHPMLLNSLCCPQIALTQIMSRMHIDPFGRQIINPAKAYNRIKLSTAIALSILILTANVTVIYFLSRIYILHDGFIMNQQSITEILTLLIPMLLLDLGCIAYFYMLLISTRKIIRKNFDIPQEHCTTIPDMYPSLCFTCCTISQMGRHTAEYRTYRSMCCTDTGLPMHVESIALRDGGARVTKDDGSTVGDTSFEGTATDSAISV